MLEIGKIFSEKSEGVFGKVGGNFYLAFLRYQLDGFFILIEKRRASGAFLEVRLETGSRFCRQPIFQIVHDEVIRLLAGEHRFEV